MAVLIALGVITNSLRIGKFSFGGLPIIFSGYALSPFSGFIVGGLTDILAFLVRPSSTGAINPIFVLTSALTGFIPVFISNILKDKFPKYSFWKMLIAILIGQFITSVFIVNFFIDLLYAPGTFYIKALSSAIKQLIQAPIYAYIIKEIIDKTSGFINYPIKK